MGTASAREKECDRAERPPCHLSVAGFNHARVPIRLREKYTLPPGEKHALLAGIRHCAPLMELVVLNTCNRFELYVVSARATWTPSEQVGHILRMIWPDMCREDFDELVGAAYWHGDEACVRHLFRTCSSLDSMVVGEAEINGQVKEAYHLAKDLGATGPVLNRLFQNAFTAAKRVRTETTIARGSVSVGTVAVRAGLAALPRPARAAVIIGAGRMAGTIARHLRKFHPGPIAILNRTIANAARLAQEANAAVRPLDDLPGALPGADLVFAAAAVPGFVLAPDCVSASRKGQGAGSPLVIVDVCLPRSVDPALRAMPGVRVLDLDDLQLLIATGESSRLAGVGMAERLIGECVIASWPRLLFAMGRGELPASAAGSPLCAAVS